MGHSIAADGTLDGPEPPASGTALAQFSTAPQLVQEALTATPSRSRRDPAANSLSRPRGCSNASPRRLAAVSSALLKLTVQIAPYPPPLPGETPPTTNDDLGLAFALTLAPARPGFHPGKLGALAFAAGAPYALHQAPSGGTPSLRIVAATPADDLDLEPASFWAVARTQASTSAAARSSSSVRRPPSGIARPLLAFTGSSAAQAEFQPAAGPPCWTPGRGRVSRAGWC